MSAVNNHLSTGSEDGKFTSSTITTVNLRPKKTTHNGTLTTRPTTIPQNDPYQKTPPLKPYINDPDFNCDPYHNPQIYDRETLTFRQKECTPFGEYIKKTGMNISTEPRHRPKTVQPVPDYDQDVERVTEILVDIPTNRPTSILKNQGSQITTPQSPSKDQPVNPVRAGIIQSPTMDVAPDCHQHENITCRTTTEAVDPVQPTINKKTTPSKPTTRRIKRSLLLEPPPTSIVSRKMKLNSPNPSRLTQLTCSLNPNQVLQTAHLNRTAPGPTPQSRLQNTRGKITGPGELPVPSPKTTVSLKTKSRTLDP